MKLSSPTLPLALCLLASAIASAGEALHVNVRKVQADEFPRVRVIFDLKSFEKLPFRQLTPEHVRIVEEEVAIPDIELRPYRAGVSIGLVVDDSGSQDRSLGYLREAAGALIDRLTPGDEMAVVAFGRLVRPLQQLTSDKRLLKDAVGSLKAYGASALYDGIAVGMHESASGIGRQVVVVLSDGNERDFPYAGKRLSKDTLPHLIDAARHHGINVYTVGIGTNVDSGLLETLARETGGRYLHAPRRDGLRALFDRIVESFETSYQAIYHSPNLKEDSLVRGGLVKVRFLGRTGIAPYRYSVRPKSGLSKLVVERTAIWKDNHGRLRVYTRGLRDTFVPMKFSLKDAAGKLVRQGLTTRDGYGAPLDGGMPEMLELPPGAYSLDLSEPDTDLVFQHPGILLRKGQSTDLTFQFSKLLFRRNGALWYDTEHALGETSDLVNLTVHDLVSGRLLRSGPLSTFKHRREASLWLETGAYRVRLDNHLGPAKKAGAAHRAGKGRPPPVAPPGVEPAVLRNALTAQLEAKGGDVLFFDVAYDDFLVDQDPRLIPDELPDVPHEGEEPPRNERLAMLGHAPFMQHADELRDSLGETPEETLAPARVPGAALRRHAARRHRPARKPAAKPAISAAKPAVPTGLPDAASEPTGSPAAPSPEKATPPADPAALPTDPAAPVAPPPAAKPPRLPPPAVKPGAMLLPAPAPDSSGALAEGPRAGSSRPDPEDTLLFGRDALGHEQAAVPVPPETSDAVARARQRESVAALTVVPGHADRAPEPPAPVESHPADEPSRIVSAAAQPEARGVEGRGSRVEGSGRRDPADSGSSRIQDESPAPLGRAARPAPAPAVPVEEMERLLEGGASAPPPALASAHATPLPRTGPRRRKAARVRTRRADDALVRPEDHRPEPPRPVATVTRKNETDGSVYVTPKRAEHDAAVEAAEAKKAAESAAAPLPQAGAMPVSRDPLAAASPSAAPGGVTDASGRPLAPGAASGPAPLPPGEEDVIAKLKRMRAKARATRTAAVPATDSVTRLEQLAAPAAR